MALLWTFSQYHVRVVWRTRFGNYCRKMCKDVFSQCRKLIQPTMNRTLAILNFWVPCSNVDELPYCLGNQWTKTKEEATVAMLNHWDSGKHLFVKLHRTPMGMVTQYYMMNKMNNWRNRLWWQVWLSISKNSNRDNQTRINWYPSSTWNTSKVKTEQPQEEHSLIPCHPVFLCNLLHQFFTVAMLMQTELYKEGS